MNDDKKNGLSGDSHREVLLIGAFLLLVVFTKAWPSICRFWQDHQRAILALLILGLFAALALGAAKLWNFFITRAQENSITAEDELSVLLGADTDSGRPVHLKQPFRTMHAQVIGTTNAGKSESVILPWAISDIKNGSGVLIIDGKSDASFVTKLYSYVKLYKREEHFRLFSLANPGPSSSFNPLKGNSAQEVTERVFSSFTFENEYYKNIQYKFFLSLVRLVFAQEEVPTFSLIYRLLIDMEELARWVAVCPDEMLKRDLTRFMKMPEKDRDEKTSGLETMLSHFTIGEISSLFEETDHAINFDDALAKNHIVYFQLPTMYFPFLAAATGKLVLQCFQNAVSKRQMHLGGDKNGEPEVLLLHPR